MNKLEGFFELKTLLLPSVPWVRYTGQESFAIDTLWTVRSALAKGKDFNLPRKVGATAAEAKTFADELLKKLSPDDYIVYYPFFTADKSGTLEVSAARTLIEAVRGDLWNLLTHNLRDVTVIEENGKRTFYGDETFLTAAEIRELYSYAGYLRRKYASGYLLDSSLLLEWSYARESSVDGTPQGIRKLIFIEMRTIS